MPEATGPTPRRARLSIVLEKLGAPILTGAVIVAFGVAATPWIAERLKEPACDNPRSLVALNGVTATGESLPPDAFPNKGVVDYEAGNLVDGNSSTAWVEGVDGLGVGASIRLDFGSTFDVQMICIVNGYAESWPLYSKNSRVRQLEVVTQQGQRTALLQDSGTRDQPAVFQSLNMAQGPTDYVELSITSAYAAQAPDPSSSGFADTSMSEVEVWINP